MCSDFITRKSNATFLLVLRVLIKTSTVNVAGILTSFSFLKFVQVTRILSNSTHCLTKCLVTQPLKIVVEKYWSSNSSVT